ncbi:hypothetical protein [Paenibacillus marinisediminis]
MESNKIVLPVLGALLAAVIGGAVWALIAVLTDYEIGFVAWGIGGLAGYSVYYLAKKNVNAVHQVMAVIASLIGILLGKYFILGYYYNEDISGIFNSEVLTIFQENITEFFGGKDIIFVVLAVVTAWQLPGSLAKKATATEPTINSAE